MRDKFLETPVQPPETPISPFFKPDCRPIMTLISVWTISKVARSFNQFFMCSINTTIVSRKMDSNTSTMSTSSIKMVQKEFKVVSSRKGYTQDFKYKLAFLVIYLHPHFEKLKKKNFKIPTFITNNITTIKRLTKKLSVNDLALKIAEIRSLREKTISCGFTRGIGNPSFQK